MRALVTRPKEDSEGVARALAQRGLDVMVEPLLDIVPVEGATVDTGGAQGILVTSANGIRALARLSPDRDLPIWAVGDASGRAAREMGFSRVQCAGGDVDSLAELVASRADPQAGALFHAAGTVTAGDLSGWLSARGFQVRRQVLYRAVPATRLSAALCDSLLAGGLQLALFFSPRTARTFATLAIGAGMRESLGAIAAYGLSANVSAELAPLPWRVLRQAAEPSQAALLAAIDDDLNRGFSP
ncbi:uroporphyrinogen-III synthase [Paramagnetospirillum caucaseum]|uniref:Uroporphyrinogen-III synthase n=1 Tax=Paramagnetospirillum caucaseum TaxID=1244869 RepID=M2ZS74_9PROT|nr:uroporphyrinogen-III synthase [Paramagnetospirillum caucaseum]EME70192.1 uroporphyrinogen-III synthase [Paramagnetospirillum caucaseum]